MYKAGEDFQTIDNAGARPVEVPVPVHSIDVPLAYGWQVIPARQLRQRGEYSAGLCQRVARGAEQQHLWGILQQPPPLHRWGRCPWYTQPIRAPGELNQ